MGNKLLLIVDPQIDFITGTLPVEGASAAMDSLSAYIKANAKEYSGVIVTQDYHPSDHISFSDNGGQWPVHCVADTEGAELWPSLCGALKESGCKMILLRKGEASDTEEYSIFKNPVAARRIQDIADREGIDQIDICGIAGDICVADTLEDGIQLLGGKMFRVLLPFSPSLDGGKRLADMIADKNLKYFGICDRL